MKLYKIVLLIMLSMLLIVIGCSDRGVNPNNKVALIEGGPVTTTGTHVFHQELLFQINNKFQQLRLLGYAPKISFPDDEFKPTPLLVLLPPQDGDENFFFRHGLRELADELISSGEIQPMSILCVSNDQIFGGYFFAGTSPSAGFYDDLIGGELLNFAKEGFFPAIIGTKAKTAIGGFGMGAYGAYRAAMLHPDKFSSVSGVSGPMDFDGTDNASGLIPLFSEALAEQGITGQDLPLNYSYQGDWHISRLFIGGGFAFSPHDTMYQFTPIDTVPEGIVYRLDSLYALDTLVFPLTSAISYADFSKLPNPFDNDKTIRNRFHLPFDNTGAIVLDVWNLWMNNNLPNMFAANTSVYDGMNLWIGNSSEKTFGNYYDQTNSWTATLKTAGVPVTEFNLKGYDGLPADKDQYVYDYLREMLIFHSESFGN